MWIELLISSPYFTHDSSKVIEFQVYSFGHFYFISNDELLAILSQARNPQAVQPFDALVKLDFGTGNKSQDILAMRSGEGECVGLTRNLKACGPVEEWLNNVETAMKKALRKCKRCFIKAFY